MQPLNVTQTTPRMVIDWSVLCYIAWYKMKTPGYIALSGLESDEFARNSAGYLLYLSQRFTPSELVIAVDDVHNWRAPYYAGCYETAVDFWRVRSEPHGWYVSFDKKMYHAYQNDATEKWFYDKLAKKDTEALKLDDLDLYTPFLAGRAPEWLVQNYPDAPKTVWEHPDAEGLRRIVPKYKGNRSTSRWDFETPKDEWKVLCRNIAGSLAPLVKGRAVKVDWAEGDDVVAGFCLAEPVVPTILVSTDSDLRQLCIPCLGLAIFNPKAARFVQPTREGAMWELLAKLLGGDSSDNIAGVWLPGKAPFSAVEWEADGTAKNGKSTVDWMRAKIEELGGVEKVYDWLDINAVKGPWEKNQNLIHLSRIPEALMANIRAAVAWREPDAPKLTWADFGLSDAMVLSIQHQALNDRAAGIAWDGGSNLPGVGV